MTLNATQLCIVVLNRTLVKRIGTTGLRLDSIASLQAYVACHNKVQRHGLNRDMVAVAPLKKTCVQRALARGRMQLGISS